jgi:glycosyltransferase involved in cell wall biosynthesis
VPTGTTRAEPTFTVITPTRNASAFLEASIHAVAGQRADGLSVEHLVVDDGSTDGTVEIAQQHGLRVVEGRGRGLYDAINVGIEAATHRFLSVLGSGDLLLPGGLRAVADGLAGTTRRWAVGGLRWIDAQGRPLGDLTAPPAWMDVRTFASLGWSCIHHQATFVDRALYDELGGYDPSYRISGDYAWLARALAQEPFERVPRTVAAFRRDGTNLSMSPSAHEEVERVAREHGPADPRERRARELALRVWVNARSPRWALEKQRAKRGREPVPG